jgi:hydroxymethylbilane synthase
MRIRLATRASEQARIQSEHVAARLTAAGHTTELVFVETGGDRDRSTPLHQLGGRGIFTKEVQAAVLDGRADVAVHSAKDLPSSWITEGLVLASVPVRADPRDALVGLAFDALPPGATVATGSVRRQAQLAHLRPDLRFVGLRGNIPTRIARAEDPAIDAVVVAVTGATWVGLADRISHVFEPDQMLPQVGQGAMAIECRASSDDVFEVLQILEDGDSRRRVNAERAFLARLGGGCDLPVGAFAQLITGGDGSTALELVGLVAAPDGSELYRDRVASSSIADDEAASIDLAERILGLGGHLLEAFRP